MNRIAVRLGARARSDIAGWALGSIGAYLAGISLWMLASPRSFYDVLGPFGVFNGHYVRDAASFQFALGVLALAAARRPQLRLVAIGVLAVQFSLHAVSHLIDIGAADPTWIGPAEFVGLALGAATMAWLGLRERADAR